MIGAGLDGIHAEGEHWARGGGGVGGVRKHKVQERMYETLNIYCYSMQIECVDKAVMNMIWHIIILSADGLQIKLYVKT